jgi:hypothetical protein
MFRRPGCQRIVELARQREMSEVIGCELQFPALRGAVQAGRDQARIIDEKVQGTLPGRGEVADTATIGEVQADDARPDRDARAVEGFGERPPRGDIADREGELCSGVGEHAGRLPAETRGRARDDRPNTSEGSPAHHVLGSAAGGEWRRNQWRSHPVTIHIYQNLISKFSFR